MSSEPQASGSLMIMVQPLHHMPCAAAHTARPSVARVIAPSSEIGNPG
jgi:hypothetical protein